MIEFKKDGPFAREGREEKVQRVRFIGLGQAGIHALDQLVLHGSGIHDLLVVDTDKQTLESSVVKEKILVGASVAHGMGCGGEMELAQEVASSSERELQKAISGYDFILLSVGLGGGTGNALAVQLVKLAQKEKIKVIALASLPFAFEGRRRLRQATAALAELRSGADAVLTFANDRLTQITQANGDARSGFHLLNSAMARSLEVLAPILFRRGLLPLTFADVRSLYGRYTDAEPMENCWSASFEMESAKNPAALVQGLLNDPLLREEIWQEADRGLVSISGGSKLSLVEVQNILGELQRHLPKDFPISSGAHLEENRDNKTCLTLLLAKTAQPVMTKKEELSSRQPISSKEEFPKNLQKNSSPPVPLIEDLLGIETSDENIEPEKEKSSVPANALEALQIQKPTQPLKGFAKPKKYIAKQEELPFEAGHRGRFEKSLETIHNGENLDQPTFRRRRLQIRL